ncbi:hypothetical protein ACHAWC_002522, partial [Mediolabrus comicus]
MQLLTLLTTASWLYFLLAATTTVVHAASNAAMVCPNTEEEADHIIMETDTIDAQAYKPNAPIKTSVCEESNDGSSGGGPHKLAHWSFWRSNYKDLIPISFTGNIYSCNSSGDNDVMKPITTTSSNEDSVVVMEVWQPRPDGTYSSIRPGVEEGDCRASVPITIYTQQQRQHDDEDENENNNNIDGSVGRIGTVKFDTFMPGSTGILNGLVPSSSSSSNDYPPYKSGSIHLFLNIQGFSPLVVSLDMNELESWFPKRHVGKKRFQLSGDSNKKKKKKDGNNGMEIQSVTPRTTKSQSFGKYNLAIDLEVNFFLTKSSNNHDDNEMENDEDLKSIFCSHTNPKKKKSLLFGRIISFFKEPISVCSHAYL